MSFSVATGATIVYGFRPSGWLVGCLSVCRHQQKNVQFSKFHQIFFQKFQNQNVFRVILRNFDLDPQISKFIQFFTDLRQRPKPKINEGSILCRNSESVSICLRSLCTHQITRNVVQNLKTNVIVTDRVPSFIKGR